MVVNGGGLASGGGRGVPGPYTEAKTSVWWDIENCQVPRGSDAHVIAQNISSALADVGYKGAVTISAYGDTNKIPAAVQHALSSTGIALNHVPAGIKDASDKKILVDILFWAVDNPPPANYLLISGDRDFSNALHQLRMRRYNILLAHAPKVSQALASAASSVWLWTSLLTGGQPLQNSDSCGNASAASNSCSVAGKNTIGDPNPSNGSKHTRNEDNSFIGRTNKRSKSYKPVWGNQALPSGDMSRISSVPDSKEGHGVQFHKQMSMLVISSSQAQGSTQLKHTTVSSAPCSSIQMSPKESGVSGQSEGKKFNKAPHEFFGASQPRASVGFSNQPPLPSGDISRTSSLPESKEGHGIQFQKQMSMPVISSSQVQGSTQLKHTTVSSAPYSSIQVPPKESGVSGQSEGIMFNKAPHEFFGASKPRASVGFSNQPPHLGDPINNGNNSNNLQTQYSQPLRPSMQPSLPSHSPNFHNFGSYLPPHQQIAPPFRPGPPPDFSRLKDSEYPSNAYQNGSFPLQNSGPPGYMQNSWPFYQENAHGSQLNTMSGNISCNANRGTSGCQISSSAILGLIENIQVALYQLKANKMTPTEANIADCIRYGMGIQNFNVRMALNCALEHNVIVMHKLGASLPFYIGKDDKLWNCVNPVDSNVRHPEATRDAIQKFLSSARGQSAISSTECRYHAATVLKKACLEHLALGDILQILHVIVQVKKWIIPSSHSWQPLSFSLKVATDSNAGDGVSTKVQSEDR